MDYGAAARRRGQSRHDRRRARRQPLRPAPDQGRRRARSFSRRSARCRAAARPSSRRPRGEERHRLRPLQADGRLLGHARGHDRGHLKMLPRAETEATVVVIGLDDARAVQAMTAAMGSLLRCVGRRASAGGGACASRSASDRAAAPSLRCGSKASRRRWPIAKPRCEALLKAVRRARSAARTRVARNLWRAIRDVDAVRGQPHRRPSGRSGASRPRRPRAPSWPTADRAGRRPTCSTTGPAA